MQFFPFFWKKIKASRFKLTGENSKCFCCRIEFLANWIYCFVLFFCLDNRLNCASLKVYQTNNFFFCELDIGVFEELETLLVWWSFRVICYFAKKAPAWNSWLFRFDRNCGEAFLLWLHLSLFPCFLSFFSTHTVLFSWWWMGMLLEAKMGFCWDHTSATLSVSLQKDSLQ